MHSTTEFISGHSDLMAGVLAVKGESLMLPYHYVFPRVIHLYGFVPNPRITGFLRLNQLCLLTLGDAITHGW